MLIRPEFRWEVHRIDGSTPPVRTERGWLVFYHGVENADPVLRRVVYRLGAMVLDLGTPASFSLQTPGLASWNLKRIMSGSIDHTERDLSDRRCREGWPPVDLLRGCADTSIGLATAPLEKLVDHIFTVGSTLNAGPVSGP